MTKYIEHAIDNADTNYVYQPGLADLDGRLAARWCSQWSYQSVLSLTGFREIAQEFQEAPIVPPALYEEGKGGAVDIWIGDFIISGRVSGGQLVDLVSKRDPGQGSVAKLEDWLGSVRRKADPNVKQRGFFAGAIEV